jgi:hypothetical protein
MKKQTVTITVKVSEEDNECATTTFLFDPPVGNSPNKDCPVLMTCSLLVDALNEYRSS